jgi:acetyltransferase-like isoleucine patch superfamily enzyme
VAWKSIFANRFLTGENFKFGRFFDLSFDLSSSEVSIGNNVLIRDFCHFRSGMDGKLQIGNNTFFNNNCSINCFHSIIIGDDCQFGEGVKFYDHNHQYRATDKTINEQGYSTGPIKIGNNCWFGSNVVILKNVQIGDNVIIGAGCIIYQSVPPNTVVMNKSILDFKLY